MGVLTLRTATVNFADYFSEGSWVRIEPGKDANFLFLNENPLENLETVGTIEGLFFNKHCLDKAKLEDMAMGIRPAKQ